MIQLDFSYRYNDVDYLPLDFSYRRNDVEMMQEVKMV